MNDEFDVIVGGQAAVKFDLFSEEFEVGDSREWVPIFCGEELEVEIMGEESATFYVANFLGFFDEPREKLATIDLEFDHVDSR